MKLKTYEKQQQQQQQQQQKLQYIYCPISQHVKAIRK